MCCVFLDSKFSRLRRAPNKPGFQKRFLRAQERASAIHRTIQQPRGSSSMTLCFHECRNALLLFVKQSRLWQPHRRRSCAFTSVGTRFYYSQNNLTAAQTQFLAFHECRDALLLFAKMIQPPRCIINNIIRTGGGIARRRRKIFTVLPFKIQ